MKFSLQHRPGARQFLVLTILFFAFGIHNSIAQTPTFTVPADLPDGLGWTPRHIGVGSSFDSYEGISYGNGLLVVDSWYVDVPDNIFFQTIYRSSHGMAGPWTADTLNFFHAGNIRFLKDHFYKLGPVVQVSTDALNWTALLYKGTDSLGASEGFTDSASVYLIPVTQVDSPGILLPSANGLNFDSTILTPISINQGPYFGQHYFAYGFRGITSILSANGADIISSVSTVLSTFNINPAAGDA